MSLSFTKNIHSPIVIAMFILVTFALVGATYLSSKALSFDLRNKSYKFYTILKFLFPLFLAILLGYIFKFLANNFPYIPKEIGFLTGLLISDVALYQSFRNYSNQQDKSLFQYENQRILKINNSYYWSSFLYYLDVTIFVLSVLIIDLLNLTVYGKMTGMGNVKYVEAVLILIVTMIFHIFSEKIIVKFLNIKK